MTEVQQGGIRMITVGDFMTRDLVTVKEADDLALAESILRLGGIRHLPVVRDGRLAGLLTQRDLLRSAAHRGARTTQAADIMVRDVMTVQRDLEVLKLDDVQQAKVGSILATLKAAGE